MGGVRNYYNGNERLILLSAFFHDLAYKGAVRYPMGRTILFSSIILKKCVLKN
jgi:hypothetical protein